MNANANRWVIQEEYLHPAEEPIERKYQEYCPRSETDQITKFIRY
jgi:hypothetical protein